LGGEAKVYFVAEDYWPLNTALYVSDFNGNDTRFVYSMRQTLPYEVFSGKSAVPGIDRNDLHPLPVCCPSVREYRAALISAAATGNVDVRGGLEEMTTNEQEETNGSRRGGRIR
jgi:type I restriction enzyme, S subunit